MARLDQLLKDQKFLKALNLAFLQFGNEFGLNPYQYFASLLNYKTTNEFQNHLQPYSNKYLKVDELFIILDNLGNFKDSLLQYICNRYDYTAVPKLSKKIQTSPGVAYDIQDSFNKLPIHIGQLFNNYLESMQDNIIDEDEKETIQKTVIQLRKQLLLIESFVDIKADS